MMVAVMAGKGVMVAVIAVAKVVVVGEALPCSLRWRGKR